MDASFVALAVLGLFLAGIVKGATGLGYASCALPFLAAAFGLKPAMALVIVPAMATNVTVALSAGHLVDIARRFRALYLAMIPGIAAGLALLLWINPRYAEIALGLVIIAYVAMALARPELSISPRAEALLKIPTGLANGLVTGLTGSQVMPLFPYMMALGLEPNRLVQAINLAVLIASGFLAAGLLATGIMTWPLAGISLAAVLPALAGVEIGTRVRALISVAQFRTLVLAVLALTGVVMLVR